MELIKIHRRNRDAVLHWLIENVAELKIGSNRNYRAATHVNAAAQVAEWHAVDNSWRIVQSFAYGTLIHVECVNPLHATYIALKWS